MILLLMGSRAECAIRTRVEGSHAHGARNTATRVRIAASGDANGRRTERVAGRRREAGHAQPCFTSISTLLKMLFPLDGSVGVPFSITPVRFAQMVLPAIANGPSLST